MRSIILILLLLPALSIAQVIEYSPYSDTIDLCSVEKPTVDSAFDFLTRELSFIDFDDCNNCDSRAHITARILERKFPGIKTAKVWLFADFKRASNENKPVKTSYLILNDECDNWGYHVATIVLIPYSERIDTIVIDPTTGEKPVTLNDWASKIITPGGKAFLIIKDKKYYSFPDNSNNKFEDEKEIWIDEDKILYDDYCEISIEKVLASKLGIKEPWTYRWQLKTLRELLGDGK